MSPLVHNWFDPTILMSRNVQWCTLPQDNISKNSIIETLRSGLLQQQDVHFFDAPKKRGRQKNQNEPEFLLFDESLLNHIGIRHINNDIYSVYYIKVQSIVLGMVAFSVTKCSDSLIGSLDLIYILPEWRKRGLGTSIAEHSGLWINNHLANKDNLTKIIKVSSFNIISSKLVSSFIDSVDDHSKLLDTTTPVIEWTF